MLSKYTFYFDYCYNNQRNSFKILKNAKKSFKGHPITALKSQMAEKAISV